MMSPAAVELARHRITGAQLARDLGLTRSAVSFQLCGEAESTSPRLLDAIAARGGEELAHTIDRLIDEERGRRRIHLAGRGIQRATPKELRGEHE